MKTIAKLEMGKEQKLYYEDIDVAPILGQAYFNSQDAGNDLIDFHDAIWENQLTKVDENLKEFGVDEFTISSSMSGLVEVLGILYSLGWVVDGVVKVNANYMDFHTGKPAQISALHMVTRK